jgi:hypothetical protein
MSDQYHNITKIIKNGLVWLYINLTLSLLLYRAVHAMTVRYKLNNKYFYLVKNIPYCWWYSNWNMKAFTSGVQKFENESAKLLWLILILAMGTSSLCPNHSDLATDVIYLRVTIICRYIFLRFWLKMRFASTKFCDLYTGMVQGRHILMFYSTYS